MKSRKKTSNTKQTASNVSNTNKNKQAASNVSNINKNNQAASNVLANPNLIPLVIQRMQHRNAARYRGVGRTQKSSVNTTEMGNAINKATSVVKKMFGANYNAKHIAMDSIVNAVWRQYQYNKKRNSANNITAAFQALTACPKWCIWRSALFTDTEIKRASRNINDEDMMHFSIGVRNGALPHLLHLDLTENDIGPAGANALATAISSGSLGNLKELHLYFNQIRDTGMIKLSRAIASGSLPNLSQLGLGDNKIGDAGVSALAGAIASGSLGNLQKLYLFRNNIGNDGMKAFAEALARGSMGALQLLYLSNNKIGDAGVSALAGAIASGPLGNLRELNLYGNQIGDAGMTDLSHAIASGSLGALKALNLRENPGNQDLVKQRIVGRGIQLF